MSQENRDERLGLTGLTPEQRRRRIEEMERELDRSEQIAEAKLRAAWAAMDNPDTR